MSLLVFVLFVISFISCLTSLFTTNKCRKLLLHYQKELNKREIITQQLLYACREMDNILNTIRFEHGIPITVEFQDVTIVESKGN